MPRRKRYEGENLRGVGAVQSLSFTFFAKNRRETAEKRRKRDEQQTQNAPQCGAEEPRDDAQKHNVETAQHNAAQDNRNGNAPNGAADAQRDGSGKQAAAFVMAALLGGDPCACDHGRRGAIDHGVGDAEGLEGTPVAMVEGGTDRKSTRLNSSHLVECQKSRIDRKSTRLNSSHLVEGRISRMPSSD